MGQSGMKGKVYYVHGDLNTVSCPPLASCDYDATKPSGTDTCWYDEVTQFTVVDSVQKREYGHDKSDGWQDVVAGTRRLSITLDAVVVPAADGTLQGPLRAGRVVFLMLYPFGTGATCGNSIMKGYAMIDQISYTVDQETGKPVSYTASLSSKLEWTGMNGDDAANAQWGGFECECTT